MNHCTICAKETSGSYLGIPLCISAYIEHGIVDVHVGFDNSSYHMTLLGTSGERDVYLKNGYLCKEFGGDGLLPCPFCGRKADLVERSGGWDVSCYYKHPIHCVEDNEYECGVELYTALTTREKAIEIWNDRFDE